MFGYHKQLLASAREAQMTVRRLEYYAKMATWTAQRRNKDPDLGPMPTMKHDFNRVEQGALMKHAQKVRELLLFLLLMLLLVLLLLMMMMADIMIMTALFCNCCRRMSLLIITFAAALLLLLLAAAVDHGTRLPFAGIFPRPRQLGVDGGRCLPRHACGRREPASPQGGQRRVHDAQAGRQRVQGAAAHGRAGGARAGAGRARCRLVGVDRGAQRHLEARRRQSRVEAPGGVHQP